VRFEAHDNEAVLISKKLPCAAGTGTITEVPAGTHRIELCLFYDYPGETLCYGGTVQVASFTVAANQTATLGAIAFTACESGGLPYPC
jgi:hypothetical protein